MVLPFTIARTKPNTQNTFYQLKTEENRVIQCTKQTLSESFKTVNDVVGFALIQFNSNLPHIL